MSTHTQGDWSRNIKPAAKYNTIFAGRNTHVCHLATQGLSVDEVESNCNLIVASPELLNLAKEMRSYFQSFVDDGVRPDEWIMQEWIRKCDVVISKAETK